MTYLIFPKRTLSNAGLHASFGTTPELISLVWFSLSLSLSLSLLSLLCAKLFSFLFGGEDDDQNSSFFLLTVFQISPFNFTPFLCVKFRVLDKKFFLGPPLSSFLKKKNSSLSWKKRESRVLEKAPLLFDIIGWRTLECEGRSPSSLSLCDAPRVEEE